jgi:ribonuclease HII
VAAVIAGVDEVGRGAWAGPVYAAAVVLPDGHGLLLRDSKAQGAVQRQRADAAIRAVAHFAIGSASVAEIDAINILQATLLAMARAVAALAAQGVAPGLVLVDGNRAPDWHWPTRTIIGGDAGTPCISAASIVAKVARDALMVRLAGDCPGYGWAANKGYGTALHRAGLAAHGVSGHHRRSFAPVRALLMLPAQPSQR